MTERLITRGPSLIDGAGLGCFATAQIAVGERVTAAQDAGKNRRLPQSEVPDAYLKYCPLLENGLFLAPASFLAMSAIWYINHAREPNLTIDEWRLRAARDIEPGEELTMYYPDLLTHPINQGWVIPELHV